MKIIFAVVLIFSGLQAKSLNFGEAFPYNSFSDQFDKKIEITNNIKKIIITFSKSSGELVKAFLDKNRDYLKINNAIYLVDITKVPSFAKFLFLMPSLKKSAFSIGLLKDEDIVKNIPKHKGKITVIHLQKKEIVSILFLKKL